MDPTCMPALQIPQQAGQRLVKQICELADEWRDLASLNGHGHGDRVGHEQPDRGTRHDCGDHRDEHGSSRKAAQTARRSADVGRLVY